MSRFLFLLASLSLLGCGAHSGKNPDPVEVEGRVTLKSKPVSGVTLQLQPTGTGTQASLPLKDGTFRGSVTPGKYTYYVSEGSNTAAFQVIPEKYRAGALDRQIHIGAGSKLDLTLD
ncbi:MAG: hypothetical protein L0215_04640 [Gemmataceae bacterium]|nr:hypothetical protein [Gemmataceae bacterium]